MQVGDLVTVVQSRTEKLVTPFVGQSGIIISKVLSMAPEKDMFVILTRDKMLQFRRDYLEVVNDGR
jgi:hypothetical protein